MRFVKDEVALGQFLSDCFRFTVSVSSDQCSTFINSSSTDAI